MNIVFLYSKTSELTLNASNWSGTEAPYSYVISNSDITASNILDLIINTNTQDLIDKLSSYKLSGYKQEAGKITIYAWGAKPTTDINTTLVVRGGY